MTMMKVSRVFGAWGIACGLLLAGMWVGGCRTKPAEQGSVEPVPGVGAATSAPAAAGASNVEPAAPSAPSAGGNTEILSPGDYLTIVYSDTPILVPNFEGQVKEDGTVTLIYNKEFKAAGKTRGELEKEIRAWYVPAYFKNMTVNIRAAELKVFYYVGGEVRSPGRIPYINKLTLLKAIQSAGDFTDFANKKKVQITRAGNKRIETVNCVKAIGNPKLDVEIFPGDNIHVFRRWF